MNRTLKPIAYLALVVPASLALLAMRGEEPRPAGTGTPVAGSTSIEAPSEGRVVVLGFDGADARTIRELMAASPGAYPTFEKLASEGTFAPLEVVAPPESPVSWAALNTGQNPAKTGVPGFIQRKLPNPLPDFGHIESPVSVPIEEFETTPIPTWSAGKLGGIAGGVVFVVVLVLLLLVTRGKFVVAAVVALVLGGGAGYAGMRMRGYLPDEIPITKNPNQAKNFWDHTAEAGVPTVVLDAAQAFDMPAPDGAKVLAGLGVPDARGGLGDWFVYTTDPDESNREGRGTTTAGTVFRVDDYGGEINSKIYGPKNFWMQEQLQKELDGIKEELSKPNLSMDDTLELSTRQQEIEPQLKAIKSSRDLEGRAAVDMAIRVDGDSASVTIGGQQQTVSVGEWSEFYEVTFELNWLLKVKALTRVRLVKTEPYFELFVNVLDIDPREPPFWQPISSPAGFASELAADCGLYETYGWPTTTMPVKDREIDPELLMEDVEFTMKWREKLTYNVLEKDDWQVFMSVFSTTDRVQHMMYSFFDEGHPKHDPEAAARTMTFFGEEIALGEAIPAIYRQMDRVVGEVLGRLDPGDTLLVCSDHGFQSFRRQVNVNNWLIENGYLAMKSGTTARTKSFLLFVDWAKTRVYSLGMGFLYVNMQGREAKGTVPPSEADALMAEVREKLLQARDPQNGAQVCKNVYVTKEVHSGPFLDRESDMLIGFAPTYRVSWSSTSGGIHMVKEGGKDVLGPVFTDNDSPWSGGHISVNLPDVAGVFFSNKKVDVPEEGVRALQIAPTVLSLTGVDVPSEMDLGPLTVR
jgi:predicted AlkP superfamily phosphohydrolase/phosphomutase